MFFKKQLVDKNESLSTVKAAYWLRAARNYVQFFVSLICCLDFLNFGIYHSRFFKYSGR